jgi:predicted metal-binding membrane protein
MSDMPMPGGGSMSMMWMPMPGQTWLGTATSFLGMWTPMMAAMMLPSLVPMLWHYRRSLGETSRMRLAWLIALVGFGYFFVWTMLGAVVFPLGAALAAFSVWQPVLARAVPIVGGAVVVIAGVLQLTTWKARRVARCSETPGCDQKLSADTRTAWRHGLHLGVHCAYCCAELMTVLLILGVMDLRAMAAVTTAITAERLAPAGVRVARVIGAVVVATGVLLIAADSSGLFAGISR